MNFQDALKDLGKQAREAAKLREQAEQEAKKIQQEQADVDFAALMKDVTPLKNAHANYVPPRDTSPIKLRPKDTESDKENHFYIGESGVILDIPDTFSKTGRAQMTSNVCSMGIMRWLPMWICMATRKNTRKKC